MHRKLPDYLRPGLNVVFVGINPGEYSAEKGHYYARRTNKFWELLSKSGLVGRTLTCEDDSHILALGIGLTDVVKRPTKSASDLSPTDYLDGAPALLAKLQKYRPRVVAFNGVTGYQNFRRALGYPTRGAVRLGKQAEPLEGAEVFVLPSTSAANAGLTTPKKLAYFRRLARWVKRSQKGEVGIPKNSSAPLNGTRAFYQSSDF